MKGRLIYVELKSGHSDNGPAWIGIGGASKTGSTLYSNGKAFRSSKGRGIGANYFDIETGEEYWISGVKRNNQDRHWAGNGDVLIDESAIKLYLNEMKITTLPRNIKPTILAPAKQQNHHAEIEHQMID